MINNLISELITVIENYCSVDSLKVMNQDPETLHQLRVKSRTLMSLLPEKSALYADTKQLIKQSNKIRDLDVFLTESILALPEETQAHLQKVTLEIQQHKLQLEVNYKRELLNQHLPLLTGASTEDYDRQHNDVLDSDQEDKQKLSILEIEKTLHKIEEKLMDPDITHKRVHKLRLKVKKIRYQVTHYYSDQSDLVDYFKYLQKWLGVFHDKDVCLEISEPYLVDKALREEVFKVIANQQKTILTKVRKRIKKRKSDETT